MKRVITAADGLSSRDRAKIAKTTTNPRELQRLAYDKSEAVRQAVAENKATPQSVLSYLADDEDPWVRMEVAKKTDGLVLLEKFCDDDNWLVRMDAAERIDDPAILAKLVDDEHNEIRRIVARRTDDPRILAKLADDTDKQVRKAAREKLGISSPKRTKKPTQTDWSIPIYELENYNDIAEEIDAVLIETVEKAVSDQFPGQEFSYQTTGNSYDDPNGKLVIDVSTDAGPVNYQIPLADFLPAMTYSQRKKDCVKNGISYLIKQF